MKLRDDRHGAILSDDREYRYRLTRTWDDRKPSLGWILLNPSTADETEDDPTIRRCIGYAKDWGYGSIVVGNLFALRTSEPDDLPDHPDPVGPENDHHLRRIAQRADMVFAGWGTNGGLHHRDAEVYDLMQQMGVRLRALNTTKDGHPAHPLYQPADADPEPFALGEEVRSKSGGVGE